MELQDFLSKLSLPQDFTRRGFLKATSVMAAIGMMNQPKSRRKTPRNPVRSRSFKLKVRETHGLFIDSNSAPII